jgi:hypothetical protein
MLMSSFAACSTKVVQQFWLIEYLLSTLEYITHVMGIKVHYKFFSWSVTSKMDDRSTKILVHRNFHYSEIKISRAWQLWCQPNENQIIETFCIPGQCPKKFLGPSIASVGNFLYIIINSEALNMQQCLISKTRNEGIYTLTNFLII